MHWAMSAPLPPLGRSCASPVANLVASAQRGTVSIDLLLGAFAGGELISCCLAVESAGAAAMVFLPGDLKDPVRLSATVAALRQLQERAWRRSIVLLEALLEEDSGLQAAALSGAGFRRLTRLIYLRRDRRTPMGNITEASRCSWLQYLPERDALFASTLERTYVQSMDCPELTGLRCTADVLRGHRATELFDPTLWWVLQSSGEPVGILLLNRLPTGSALEVEYVGVIPQARGTGVADALLQRAVMLGRENSADCLALAVDCRNTPARRWYARWGFETIGAREAWIANPPVNKHTEQ